MPSFDIVSEVDLQEVRNAVDQSNKEVATRFDFKGSGANFELNNSEVKLVAPSDFQLKQMAEIFENKLTKRQIDIRFLNYEEPEVHNQQARQAITVKQGISSELAKKIVKHIKDQKLKVQASIQGEQVRVTGKKRDDLQDTIANLRNADFDIPMQYKNFRD